MNTTRWIAAVLLTLVAFPAAWSVETADAAEPRIRVELQRTKIYEGESVFYSVAVDNVENPVPPKLDGFGDAGFDVQSLGTDVRDSTSITIINGRQTKTVRRGRVYNYRLTPRRAGLLKVPAPTAEADGQVLRGQELELEVIVPVQQDVANISISADPPTVYPSQAFTVTLSVAVKGLPDRYADQPPINVSGTDRLLEIPWIGGDELPEGLRPLDNAEEWLNAIISRSGDGFRINQFATRDIIGFRSRRAFFLPKARRSPGTDAAGNPVEYWEYRFSQRFVADRVGQFAFGPARLKGGFVDGIVADGRPNTVEVYVVAKPLIVTVKGAPTAGRPVSYTGALGSHFELRARLAPTMAKVGDPMQLTLTLTGDGSIQQAGAPDLEKLPEIIDHFKVEKTDETTRDQQRRFIYTVRPRHAGIEALPAIPFSFFDVQNDRFATVYATSIPIEIGEAQQMTEAEIVAGSPRAGGQEFELQAGGIFANIADSNAVRDRTVRPARWLAGLMGMVALYGVVATAVWGVRRRMENPALVRRRGAAAKARQRLAQAAEKLEANRLRDAADRVRAAMVGLVADVADLPEAGLTPREVERQLNALAVPEELIAQLHALWERCDAAQFGASAATLDQLGQEAGDLVDALIPVLKTKPRTR